MSEDRDRMRAEMFEPAPMTTMDDLPGSSGLSGLSDEEIADLRMLLYAVAGERTYEAWAPRIEVFRAKLRAELEAREDEEKSVKPIRTGDGEMAEELRSRLPEPRDGMKPDLCIAVEDGEWEIEFVPLDPSRNVCIRRATLRDALQAVFEYDDEVLRVREEKQ